MAITYQDVEVEINKCIAEGLTPSIPRIRKALGNTGSPNTIHKHLKSWRENAPVVARQEIILPEKLEAEIIAEIERQSAVATVDVQNQLIEANEEVDLLAIDGEKNEALIEELQVKNKEVADENLRLTGLSEQQNKDLEGLSLKLDNELKSSEETRIRLAKEELKNEQFELAKKELKTLKIDFESKKDEASQFKSELKIEANKLTLLDEKNEFLVDQVKKLEDLLVSEKKSYGKNVESFDSRLSAREVEIKSLNKTEFDELKRKIESLEKTNNELLSENKLILSNASKTDVELIKMTNLKENLEKNSKDVVKKEAKPKG